MEAKGLAMSIITLARTCGVVALAVLAAAGVGVNPAQAATHRATYRVTGADSRGLAVQSEPRAGHVIRYVANGTALNVVCQINDGGQVDGKAHRGRPFTTWDRLSDGTWVYDWYMTTPTVGADGYSSGIKRCGTKSALPSPASGCVDWPASKFLQTPLTRAANSGAGYAWQNGSYYDEGFHKGCGSATTMNQHYALDLGMKLGDPVLAPGGAGTVKYAGWAPKGWQTCGQYVVVDHGGGWWSVVCHLERIAVRTGQRITKNTIVGTVGGTGGFAPHLHFSLMRNAKITSDGGVYGGQSARPRHVHHLGCIAGHYDHIVKGQKICY
ncbi:M23 family metallopeptidase [Nonomuraea mesophila]|uniref:M23 family metallopeptidase n=2 Tax=Nonomuraea mesophila TaxID=2530382 RepID=A0A4R5FF29_9ACTN|nr:M23 family metallopeptidase [Nonomuraea mesophila]